MKIMSIVNDFIVCGTCGHSFERGSVSKYCSNCFACTGCEIYYCPLCDAEIIIKPVRRMDPRAHIIEDNKKRRNKKK
jgi:hypothetical protein